MRFMMIVKNAEDGGESPELNAAMEKLIDREVKAGRLVDFGGLMPMAQGMQVRLAKGKLDVIDGPFVEAKEFVGGYAVFELASREEALASAVEFMNLHKDYGDEWEGICEVRPMATA
jgi:Uncharacterized protein conserved in bacteria